MKSPQHVNHNIINTRQALFILSLLLPAACGPSKEVSACDYPLGCETKGYGDVEGYGNKQVGLCSYLGGCMESSGGE